jgi:mannose-1-phosphate guanylyltransferase
LFHSPELLEQIENSWQACINKKSNDKLKIEIPLLPFKDCPNISIDYALMEQSKNVAMIPANFNWNDVGSWLSFSALSKPDIKGKNTKNNNHVKQLNV